MKRARGSKQAAKSPCRDGGTSAAKHRKLQLFHEDEQDVVGSMFRLPERVARLPACSKYRTKQKCEGPPMSYLEMRQQRENFRARLVAFITSRKSEERLVDELPNRAEREMLRYHYYVRHGIDTAHVPPLERAWLDRIYGLIPARLQRWKQLLRALTDQVHEQFVLAVKKAVVAFVLQEPGLHNCRGGGVPVGREAPRWRAGYLAAAKRVRHNLHATSPLLAQLLDLWHKAFNDMRLVDVEELKKHGSALDLADFQQFAQKHIDNARDCLQNQWFPIIQNIFLQGNKKKLLPSPDQRLKMKHFYNCVAALMTYHLQSLCVASIQDFTHFICGVKFNNPGFAIHVVQRNSRLMFEPTFGRFEEVFLGVIDAMIAAVSDMPRLETILYVDCRSGALLKPIILSETVDAAKRSIIDVLEDQRVGPELRVQDFDDYMHLVNGEAQEAVDAFLSSQHAFEDFVALVMRFHRLSQQIPCDVAHVVTMELYEIHREDLMHTMVGQAEALRDQLLARMARDYHHMCKQLGDEYQSIANNALRQPVDTEDLMQFIAYVQKVESDTVVQMEERLREVCRYMLFLSDYTTFTAAEMKQNSATFQWYSRMATIFEEHRQIVEQKTLEYQDALKMRIKKFEDDLQQCDKRLEELKTYGDIDDLPRYLRKSLHLDSHIQGALQKIQQFNSEERAFKWEQSSYPLRNKLADKLAPYKKLYESGSDFLNKHEMWMSGQVGSYDPGDIEAAVEELYHTICDLERGFEQFPAVKQLSAKTRMKIEEFKEHLPIVKTLGNPGMKERHWEKVSEIVGFPIKPGPELTLAKVIDFGLDEFIARFEAISDSASREDSLEKALAVMQTEWSAMKFRVNEYRDSGTHVVSAVDDIQSLLDDHIVSTQTMKSSPYIKPFQNDIVVWEGKLQLLQEILDAWLGVQHTWLSLEPVFSSPDIQQQMPEEGRRFSAVDKIWRDIMKCVVVDTRVLSVVDIDKMLERLKKCTSLLEVIQRGLNDYLERKRAFFPRFFFLSNDQLLETLSQTKDPTRVQPQLCFEGIAELNFSDELEVVGMRSSEGEEVPFVDAICTASARGQVEKWLLQTEAVMKTSITKMVERALDDYACGDDNQEWALRWPQQAVLCATMISWTAQVSRAINDGPAASRRYLATVTHRLDDTVHKITASLGARDRLTLGSLVVLDAHARDVLTRLVENEVHVDDDFQWKRELRYYLEDGKVAVRMVNTTLDYGYEYLGNHSRLVVTGLTDRCYRTLFGALQYLYGVSLEGPAGTGKTETIKDVSKAVAKQCVIVNSSGALDCIGLAKFFKGFASCGAWICFDDINRVEPEVLSLVAHHLLSAQRAIRAQLSTMVVAGLEVNLIPQCAVFATMNPEYAGRCQLPENLKALFRPLAVMVADFVTISEIVLMSYGIAESRTLALKLVTTFELCADLLSPQHHYDNGIRPISTVLSAFRHHKLTQNEAGMSDDTIMVRSINDVCISKFVGNDLKVFKSVLSDVFPGVETPASDRPQLALAVREACKAHSLQCEDPFLEAIARIHRQLDARQGIVVLGQPFAGKTSACRVLATALCLLEDRAAECEHRVQMTVINPKSLTLSQLYGQFDPVTHEWSDGVIGSAYRSFATSTSSDRKWLVFDGPVDSSWIENLNTVLDDNRRLSLMSGEVIPLGRSTNLIFETTDVDSVTPATVSRCAFVHMDQASLGWQPLLRSWTDDTLPESLGDVNKHIIDHMFQRFCPPLLYFVRHGGAQELSRTSDANLVQSTTNLLDCFLSEFKSPDFTMQLSDLDMRAQIEGCFFFSCVWSIGGSLDAQGRDQFNILFRALMKKEFDPTVKRDFRLPFDIIPPLKSYICSIPDGASVYDYRFTKKGRGQWKLWADELVAAPPIPRDIPVNQITVPTVETVRNMALVHLLVTHGKLVMVTGPTGTGKTSYIASSLDKLDKELYAPLSMNFSARTTAGRTQRIIMGKLDRRRKGVYGPPLGKRCVVFVDDVNMPLKEECGAQPTIELLRQLLDHWQWHSLRDTTPITLIDMQLVCAKGVSSKGGSAVTPRFLRHFNSLCINEFSDEILTGIFSKIMLWHLDTRGFSKEFDPCIKEIVSASLELHKMCLLNLVATPAKSHYLFSLRDISRVMQGVLLSVPEAMEDLQSMKRLWVHEVLRVYLDRLVDKTDRKWLVDTLCHVCNTKLNEEMPGLFSRIASDSQQVGEKELRQLIFCDFANPKADTRNYIEVVEIDHLKGVCEGYLNEFNNMTKKPMNIILFRFALEHLSRVCRILKQPRGHGLLVGPSGSGKLSLARLAAHISEYETHQVEITKTYGITEWWEDMKAVMRKASASDQHVAFLLTEPQIKDEAFLEDVNNLLNTGEVPNLFSPEEKADICEKMKMIDQQKDKSLQTDGSDAALFNLFLTIVRQQLHVVLTMSPAGSHFRARIRRFPSIVSCCTIDWFQEWPPDALLEAASYLLSDVSVEKEPCIRACRHFHASAGEVRHSTGRPNHVTPMCYLDLVHVFRETLGRKRKDVQCSQERYEVAVAKLDHVSGEVAALQGKLVELQPDLQLAAKSVQTMTALVDKESAAVSEVEKIVKAQEMEANKQAAAVQALKDECEANMASVVPTMEDAITNLSSVTSQDVANIRSTKAPPRGVKLFMEVICILKEVKPDRSAESSGNTGDDYTAASRRLLGDKRFVDSLLLHDKDSIPGTVSEQLHDRIPSDDVFNEDVVQLQALSPAAEALYRWAVAVCKYDRVQKEDAGKWELLQRSGAELEAAAAAAEVQRGELEAVQDKLRALEADLEGGRQRLGSLQAELELCQKKLQRAEELVACLGGDRHLWVSAASRLRDNTLTLTGDVLLSSAIVAYLGPFTSTLRAERVKEWTQYLAELKLTCSSNFSLTSVLGDPLLIQEWVIDGLPPDEFSIENAIIICNSQRFPLVIDTQGQASKWIRNLEKNNNLNVVRFQQTDYTRMLENALQLGQPVLMENVGEELDSLLEPVLMKHTFRQGGTLCIKVGESIIEYNTDFRLYLTTKLRSPRYPPEALVKVTVVNFSSDCGRGLADQLVAVAVLNERPDVETEKRQLVAHRIDNRTQLKDAENKILHVLSSHNGDILEDEVAVQVVVSCKTLSTEVAEKEAACDEVEKGIDETRQEYRAIAEQAVILFCTAGDLATINPMYQYSLNWFISLFKASFDNTEKVDDLQQRLADVGRHFRYSFYVCITRSLLEKDKLIFSVLLVVNMLKIDGLIEQSEWSFFLTGGDGEERRDSEYDWLPSSSWEGLRRLSELRNFKGLLDHVSSHAEQWRAVQDSLDTRACDLPQPWHHALSPFRRLLVLRCLRPDKIVDGLRRLVADELGPEFADPPLVDLTACLGDSNSCTPLMLLVPSSRGTDPTALILELAEDQGVPENKLQSLSLGHAQGPSVLQMLQDCSKSGSWLVLHNCHLAASIMPALEKACDSFTAQTTHPDFRLWLVTQCTDAIPATLLHGVVKVASEQPTSLRDNIVRSYMSGAVADQELLECSRQTHVFKRLLRGLCFFHGVAQERLQFGAVGWSAPYHFMDSDLRISALQLHALLQEYQDVPLEAVRYLAAECTYGSRVTNEWDHRTLTTILGNIFRQQILQQDPFFLDASGVYRADSKHASSEDCVDAARGLPLVTSPQTLGLHDNADVVRYRRHTEMMLATLLINQTGVVEEDNGTRDERVLKTATDVLDQLAGSPDLSADNTGDPAHQQPLEAVLYQEVECYSQLLSTVRSTLTELCQALNGHVVMSTELEDMLVSISEDSVPYMWLVRCYPTTKLLGSFLSDLTERLRFLKDWLTRGSLNKFWMPGLYRPRAFLAALHQNYARQNQIPICQLSFEFQVMKETEEISRPEYGAHIHGLFMEGCRWNYETSTLDEPLPRQFYSTAPVVWLKPAVSTANGGDMYDCPVYRTAERRGHVSSLGRCSNFVLAVRLPSDEPPAHWVLRGAAMLFQRPPDVFSDTLPLD